MRSLDYISLFDPDDDDRHGFDQYLEDVIDLDGASYSRDNEEDAQGESDTEGGDVGTDDGNEARNDDSNNGDVNKPEQSLAALIQESTERIERLRNAIPVTQVPPIVPPPVITLEQIRNAKPMPDFRPGGYRF